MAQIPKRSFLLLLIPQGRRDVPEEKVFLSQKHIPDYHRIRPEAGLKILYLKVESLQKEFYFQLKESK